MFNIYIYISVKCSSYISSAFLLIFTILDSSINISKPLANNRLAQIYKLSIKRVQYILYPTDARGFYEQLQQI